MRRRDLLLGAMAGVGVVCGCGARGGSEPTPAEAATPSSPPRRASVRVLTYNVLADELALDRRIPALLRVMERARPDILALQEVAPWFLDWMAGCKWLRELEIATIDGQPARPNGQLIASRLPIVPGHTRARRLSGAQGRTVLISRVDLGEGQQLCVATTHMESYLEDGPTRATQLDEIFAELGRERDDPAVAATVFCGDLNFGVDEQPDTAHLDPAFVDAWTRLHPDDPGYTWDIERSEMARAGSFVGESSRRLDRVLIRASAWQPGAIEIIGDQPVEPGDRRLFPSDHFGLVCELARS